MRKSRKAERPRAVASAQGTRTSTTSRATPPRPDALTLASFTVFVVLVATNVVAIRFTNRELPPFWGAGTRFALASLVFLVYVVIRRLPLPGGGALLSALLFGALQFGIGFALAYWALQEVPAGLGSVILAAVPLFTLLFAVAARLEALRRFRWVVLM